MMLFHFAVLFLRFFSSVFVCVCSLSQAQHRRMMAIFRITRLVLMHSALFFSLLFSLLLLLLRLCCCHLYIFFLLQLKPAFRDSQKILTLLLLFRLFGFEMSLLLFYANVNSINFIDLPHCQLSTRAMCYAFCVAPIT